jgi:hypothetical protein
MQLPWISRYAHEAMLEMLRVQVAELKEERRTLLDRLASMGLGGPLFTRAEVPAAVVDEEPEQDLVDPNELRTRLLSLARIPSRQRAEVSRLLREEQRKRQMPPSVARVMADMDAVEAEGRKQA